MKNKTEIVFEQLHIFNNIVEEETIKRSGVRYEEINTKKIKKEKKFNQLNIFDFFGKSSLINEFEKTLDNFNENELNNIFVFYHNLEFKKFNIPNIFVNKKTIAVNMKNLKNIEFVNSLIKLNILKYKNIKYIQKNKGDEFHFFSL